MSATGNASGITGTTCSPAARLSESANGALDASLIVDTITINDNGVADVLSTGGAANAVGGRANTSGGMTALTDMIGTAAVIDQTTPNTRPVKLKIKLTDVLGNNVSAPSLPVLSISTVGSNAAVVTQAPPGNFPPDSLFPYDATSGTSRFSLKARGYKLGS